jgi:hypothetical protein
MPNCWWVETGHFSHIYREHQDTQGHQSRWHVNTVTPSRKGSRGNHGICIHNVIGVRFGHFLHHTPVSLLVHAIGDAEGHPAKSLCQNSVRLIFLVLDVPFPTSNTTRLWKRRKVPCVDLFDVEAALVEERRNVTCHVAAFECPAKKRFRSLLSALYRRIGDRPS